MTIAGKETGSPSESSSVTKIKFPVHPLRNGMGGYYILGGPVLHTHVHCNANTEKCVLSSLPSASITAFSVDEVIHGS